MLRQPLARFALYPGLRVPLLRTASPQAFTARVHYTSKTMSTTARDVTSFSDISKQTVNAEFKRGASTFRNFISREEGAKFAPKKGRYHLYVSYACPWATRTLIVRSLKGLESFIGITVVSPRMGEHGWPFAPADEFPGAQADPHHEDSKHVKDLYLKADPNFSGRFTVPVLWDIETSTIVNNESSEIIRMLNTEFDDLLPAEAAGRKLDLYPQPLRGGIDSMNEWIYDSVNNGVYKTGFARSQEAYEANFRPLFSSLDRLEEILKGKDYLIGNTLTELDVRLWVTIIRFDPVYVGHFKCNKTTIRDGYPEINRWMKNLYWKNDAFKNATNFDHIKTHYYWSHPHINPTRVVPVGPVPHIQPL